VRTSTYNKQCSNKATYNKHANMYTLEVSYPLALYFINSLDDAISEAVNAASTGSGAGFGQRDLTFSFTTAEAANAAAESAKLVHNSVKCSVSADAYYA